MMANPALYRLKLTDGTWATTTWRRSGKYGKVWMAPHFLRRHIIDHIHEVKQDRRYSGAMVVVHVLDPGGDVVLGNEVMPIVEFLCLTQAGRRAWEYVNIPTTISAGTLTGRLARNELV
jgi:hypothetical protein